MRRYNVIKLYPHISSVCIWYINNNMWHTRPCRQEGDHRWTHLSCVVTLRLLGRFLHPEEVRLSGGKKKKKKTEDEQRQKTVIKKKLSFPSFTFSSSCFCSVTSSLSCLHPKDLSSLWLSLLRPCALTRWVMWIITGALMALYQMKSTSSLRHCHHGDVRRLMARLQLRDPGGAWD